MMKYNVSDFIRRRALMVLCCAAVMIFLSGCLDDNDRVDPVPLGYVSIYHAAPDAPALDIVVDDRRVNAQPFGYSDYSGYLNFYTGSRKLKFSSVNAANPLVDTVFDVAEGKAYSIFVINRLANIETLVVQDSAATPASGKAMVRFVNLSPDAPAIDVASTDGSLFTNTSFKQATAFRELDAKTYSFDVKSAASGEVLLTAKDVVVRPGGFYTIVTRGFAAPPAGNTNVLSVEVL
jgi:hypothetical protein